MDEDAMLGDRDGNRADTLALWYEQPGECRLNVAQARPPGEGEVTVRTLFSAISRGTEGLIFRGEVPESEFERMRGPQQEGNFPFPVKYGYCAVGLVEAGDPALIGKPVFALHPHQTRFTLPASMVTTLPDGLPPRRAVLAANMETVLNGLWDGGAGPGDRIVVVGAGIVGLLAAHLAARMPGSDVTLVDIDPRKARFAEALCLSFALPDVAPQDADLVVHASASSAGLATALDCAGTEARVLELSWYGAKPVAAPLGQGFHVRRLSLVSSQVGQVATSRRPRWDYRRRMAKALELLAAAPELDALLTDVVDFRDAPRHLPAIFAADFPGLTAILTYE